MSVIVKGMEMPLNCAMCERWSICECLKEYKDYESIIYAVDDGDLVRADDCPLVDIPTPHGRLIDADKFAETLKEVSIRQGYDKLFSDNILSVGDVFDAIAADLKGEGLDEYKLAPTIIEAEGET